MSDELRNPSLSEFAFLIGDWDMTLSRAAFLPDQDAEVHGRVEVRAIEEGGLLAMRQVVERSGPPAATWVIGRDEALAGYTALYTDNRGVSRVYEMTVAGAEWRMWRNNPEFSQRFDATVSSERDEIVGEWQKRSSAGDWEHDFDVRYTRL